MQIALPDQFFSLLAAGTDSALLPRLEQSPFAIGVPGEEAFDDLLRLLVGGPEGQIFPLQRQILPSIPPAIPAPPPLQQINERLPGRVPPFDLPVDGGLPEAKAPLILAEESFQRPLPQRVSDQDPRIPSEDLKVRELLRLVPEQRPVSRRDPVPPPGVDTPTAQPLPPLPVQRPRHNPVRPELPAMKPETSITRFDPPLREPSKAVEVNKPLIVETPVSEGVEYRTSDSTRLLSSVSVNVGEVQARPVAREVPVVAELHPTEPRFPEKLTEQVRILTNQNGGEARIRMNPPELGALDIRVHVSDDKTFVSFSATHSATRDVLEQSMGRLRTLFDAAGLELADTEVSSNGRDSGPTRAYAANVTPTIPVEESEPSPRLSGDLGDQLVDLYA